MLRTKEAGELELKKKEGKCEGKKGGEEEEERRNKGGQGEIKIV